jgi:hypothetical protein
MLAVVAAWHPMVHMSVEGPTWPQAAPTSVVNLIWLRTEHVGGEAELAPDGSYVGGQPMLAPDGSYVGEFADQE